ncbi:putative serine esterase [Spironucleus salmonicida]|uniref:Serine esterase n=1 Tax=Spironucleus salmonicida TaxID=348837 RepID=V6LJE0_9EUKA|nr:putative serine esterase [Spironucleus salmonicida]|eukprot:EST44695.1 hypothetical protein SS50377_15407 [Spironucleus salmonicida]
MNLDLRIFLRHFANQDIIQRGWHRLTFQFSHPIELAGVSPLIHDFVDRRDPSRFFDRATDFSYNSATNSISTPSFRIEFFDQIVQFSALLLTRLRLATTNFSLEISLKLDFTHFPNQIPAAAPSVFATTFIRKILLQNMLIPSIQPFSESFQDVHFSDFELVFMWRISSAQGVKNAQSVLLLQDYCFEIFYRESFENAFRQLKNMKNCGQFLLQYAEQKKRYSHVFSDAAEAKNFAKLQLQLVQKFHFLLNQDVAEVKIRQKQQQPSCVDFFEDEQVSSLSASNFEFSELQDAVSVDYPGETIQNSEKFAVVKTDGFRRKNVYETKSQLILRIDSDSENFGAENAQKSGFSEQNKLENEDSEYLVDNVGQIGVEGDVQQLQCDVQEKERDIQKQKPIIQPQKGETQEQQCVIQPQKPLYIEQIVPDEIFFKQLFNAAQDIRINVKTCVYQSDFALPFLTKIAQNVPSKQEFIGLFDAKTQKFLTEKFSQKPKKLRNNLIVTTFVHGFQGNSNDLRYFKNVIQQQNKGPNHLFLLASKFYKNAAPTVSIFELGYQLALEIIHFLAENNASIQQLKNINFVGFSLGNIVVQACIQSKIFEDFLPFLDQNISINGPHLGANSDKQLVNMGMCFLKCFNKQRCISELENHQISDLQRQIPRYNVLQAVDQTDCMELVSIGSLGFLFNRQVFIGSQGDGYVKCSSAALNNRKLWKLTGSGVGCENLQQIILINAKEKFKKGPFLDVQTGRNVHITPLIDFYTIELIIDALWQ